MQSSWRRLARETVSKWQTTCFRPSNFCLKRTKLSLFHHQHFRSIHAVAHAQQATSSHPPLDAGLHQTLRRAGREHAQEESDSPLPPARIASAAAQAVRFSVASGELPEAFLVLNSIHHANNKSTTTLLIDKLSGLVPFSAFKQSAIPFQEGTPIRLVSHSLLHSLLRHGHHDQAARLAEQLMQQGIRVHSKSLDLVFAALTNPKSTFKTLPPPIQPFTSNILSATPSHTRIQHAGGAFALRLLDIARQSGHRRTRNMFKTLITLCVINGEIIAASLIFGLLVRHWNKQVEADMAQNNVPETEGLTIRQAIKYRVTAWPSESRLDEILESINTGLSYKGEGVWGYYDDSLQALANLGVLLDHRLIPFASLSELIRLLSRGTQLAGFVEVPDEPGGPTRKVRASLYFSQVLTRLIQDLPSVEVEHASFRPPIKQNGGHMPALDLPSYNRLLRFAFEHRDWKQLSGTIWEHMVHQRSPPLKPDRYTVNIYQQAAANLKDPELWAHASHFSGISKPKQSNPESLLEEYAATLRVRNQSTNEFVTKIDFLVSSGAPKLAARYFLSYLPGSNSVDKPAESVDQKVRIKNLKRAAQHGPRLFVSALNALMKAGRFATAEKVFLWGKKAELLSWEDRRIPAWVLPIEAYTIMLWVCEGQIRRYLVRAKAFSTYGSTRTRRRAEQNLDEAKAFHRAARLVFKTAIKDAKKFAGRKPRSRKFHRDHKPLAADALFFNAALSARLNGTG
ncbi:hypothetical protein CC1G_09968 [Coprinopsis cinerea okayama7|uniref:Uncharacterized protein n=1 Tax=Coprinopsis cinerea (strain Okayama-7 / 130 / ATCC MYA-4618 / FGSC 9003) TaxID=240176 RepID=A8PGT4_COPC7|nr:hypothetical protein CC1G_09968 [Coprinopsis cinerea okayama7\|eukprot:XP_001841276.2 hypothetical protein CC1G_09968 [Coprinopsis cinerea okayama7\